MPEVRAKVRRELSLVAYRDEENTSISWKEMFGREQVVAEKEVSVEFPGIEVVNPLLLGIEGMMRCQGSWLLGSRDTRVLRP